ncbi:hypothetical protein MMC18_003501 [Xylographa bjoerkii]|nr:hypothetical protein [Xylographa bjoerkii]
MEKIPPYGILSHRWEEEEVTFQEMQFDEARQDKKGFQKIRMCCQKGKNDNLGYIWVDTCCIDKTSSSEFQEAINSMFHWYQKADKCYTYLSDVDINWRDNLGSSSQSFSESVWFQRGWTLQELIAPTEVCFFDQRWRTLGDKQSLKHEISAATGISLSILEGKSRLQDISVAEKMSWASRRITKRVEDRAYSLLGLFDVNMPMLYGEGKKALRRGQESVTARARKRYGEGKKAFRRLQEEIITQSEDHTLFAWYGIRIEQPGMLTLEPDNFALCQNITNVAERERRYPYSVTSRGLSITLSLKPWTVDTYLAVIKCNIKPTSGRNDDGCKRRMGIFLRKLNDDQYARVNVAGEEVVTTTSSEEGLSECRDVLVNVCQWELPFEEAVSIAEERMHGFRISSELLEHDSRGNRLFKIEGNLRTTLEKPEAMLGSRLCGIVGILDISEQRRKIKIITLGFDFDLNPVCFLAESSAILSVSNITSEQRHNGLSIFQRSPEYLLEWNEITSEGLALHN